MRWIIGEKDWGECHKVKNRLSREEGKEDSKGMRWNEEVIR
jgi:hypothetical protein